MNRGRRERKPAWLRTFAPAGNLACLTPVACAGCGLWVIEDRETVWERWDAGVLTGDDLTVAIILGRPLARIRWDGMLGQPFLTMVAGCYGIDAGGVYLAGHECGLARISVKPFKPPRRPRPPGAQWGAPVSDVQVREFECVWHLPLHWNGRTIGKEIK